ncbi:sensor histidine kinase [Hamadaea tsunoensis]|uniref:sensor histidine kinase n=1 Tax=Hamadaea tsunoensis TaxID=53368 RepID=UPI00041ED299|nr:sensor histidine kinase [Hamadaea tsunoensis]
MRSGPAAGHEGILHETAFYGADEEFLAIVLPFLRDGVAAGEPTVSLFGERNQALIRAAIGPASGVVFIDGGEHYLRPAAAIRSHREMLAGYVGDGAAQIRIAGDVPHPGVGVPWEWWARYEAAANEVYDEFPMYGLCPYDTRITPPEVLDHARRTHTHLVTADGLRHRSDAYQEPREFLATAVTPWSEPVEAAPPILELGDPAPDLARAALAPLQDIARLTDDDWHGLRLSVTEAVTNALLHGRPRARLRAWAQPGRIVVTVTDQGRGPADPTAGLMPGAGPGGLGLWLAHQLCAYVSLQRDDEGFTIRLIAGAPSLGSPLS